MTLLRRCLKGIEYFHATLIFAVLIPLVCAVGYISSPEITVVFYLKCLLIVVPIILTDKAIRHFQSLFWYCLLCVLLFAMMGGAVAGFLFMADRDDGATLHDMCYSVGILMETTVIFVMRFCDRIKAARRKREDPLAPEEIGFLNDPALSRIWFFVGIYVLGLCLMAKGLCDIAFFSAIVYTFLALVHEYINAAENYLNINKRTKGISKRRVYGIGFSVFFAFLVALFVGMLPAIFMTNLRHYTDIREWFGPVKLIPYENEGIMNFQGPNSGVVDMMELINGDGPPPKPSQLANAILYVIGGFCILLFLYGVFMVIRQVLRDFRNGHDDNGDVIEELEPEKRFDREEFLYRMGRRGDETEAQRIRRRYKKTIRKHRKERPAPYESPIEIETLAGLEQDEQMRALHVLYEAARYGK